MVVLNVLSLNLRKETEEDGKNNWPDRMSLPKVKVANRLLKMA